MSNQGPLLTLQRQAAWPYGGWYLTRCQHQPRPSRDSQYLPDAPRTQHSARFLSLPLSRPRTPAARPHRPAARRWPLLEHHPRSPLLLHAHHCTLAGPLSARTTRRLERHAAWPQDVLRRRLDGRGRRLGDHPDAAGLRPVPQSLVLHRRGLVAVARLWPRRQRRNRSPLVAPPRPGVATAAPGLAAAGSPTRAHSGGVLAVVAGSPRRGEGR